MQIIVGLLFVDHNFDICQEMGREDYNMKVNNLHHHYNTWYVSQKDTILIYFTYPF